MRSETARGRRYHPPSAVKQTGGSRPGRTHVRLRRGPAMLINGGTRSGEEVLAYASRSTGWASSSAPGRRGRSWPPPHSSSEAVCCYSQSKMYGWTASAWRALRDADYRGPGRRGLRWVGRSSIKPCRWGSLRDLIRVVTVQSLLRYEPFSDPKTGRHSSEKEPLTKTSSLLGVQ